MNVTQPAPAGQTRPEPTSGTKDNGKPVISSDFETFLNMLTTQLQNQDPLNPVKSTDFAVQLATFSNVEQQVQTNKILSGLASQLGAAGMSEYAGWVGKEARVVAPVVYDGTPVTFDPAPDPAAKRAELVVRNADGDVVQRLDIGVSGQPLEWSGLTESGARLPDGTYNFEIESFDETGAINSAQPPIYATISEARIEDGKPVLVLDGGSRVSVDDVTGLRDPGGPAI